MQKVDRYKSDFIRATGRGPEELLIGVAEYSHLRDAVNDAAGHKLYPSEWEDEISYDGMNVVLCDKLHGLWVQ